jgi:hypothetical protein
MTSPLEQQKKIKITGPNVVTANRLADGAVVYRTGEGEWTTEMSGAAIVSAVPAAIELLTAAREDGLRAVDAYLAPVKLDRDRVLPGNLRELIRMGGPTIDLPVTFGI